MLLSLVSGVECSEGGRVGLRPWILFLSSFSDAFFLHFGSILEAFWEHNSDNTRVVFDFCFWLWFLIKFCSNFDRFWKARPSIRLRQAQSKRMSTFLRPCKKKDNVDQKKAPKMRKKASEKLFFLWLANGVRSFDSLSMWYKCIRKL